MPRDPDAAGRRLYQQVVTAAAASLAPDEYWCIDHEEGPLLDTASKDIGAPVRMFCEALGVDWDQAIESGFRLGKVTMAR
jgi:hypothetical protein